MTAVLVAILTLVAVVAIAYFIIKKFMLLLINAILGVFLLFFVNFFHIMNWMGRPDLGYSFVTILICAIGSIPGVLILIFLSILGVTI